MRGTYLAHCPPAGPRTMRSVPRMRTAARGAHTCRKTSISRPGDPKGLRVIHDYRAATVSATRRFECRERTSRIDYAHV